MTTLSAATPDYDAIADFYRDHWCGHNHTGLISMLERLLLSDLLPGAHLLDVCCGTGTVARHLVDLGFALTGIDGSEAMVRYAAEDVPEARFLVADVRNFCLPSLFDGALCTFDSLSYMLSQQDLERVFRRVRAALRPGSSFVFDLSLEQTYKTEWQRSCSIIEDTEACFVRGIYNESERTGKTIITRFIQDGAWRRTDVTFLARCHTPEEILLSLGRSGFGQTICHLSEEEEQLRGEIGPGRACYVARRE